jgi:hypothetical protein|tara:strand:+ start:875 stop:1063 length:189 start_codon:yes stop_codon:yes gene_type:complete
MLREKKITIKNYIKMWQSDLPDGHQLRIAHGKDIHTSKVLVVDLKWPNRKRAEDGRVTTYHK